MFKTFFLTLALLVAFFTATRAHAQTVRWEPAGGTLAFNQLSELRLVFEQCEPDGTVALPAVSGLSFTQAPNRSDSTSFSVVNGQASRSRTVTLTYRVRPTERLRVTIPAFQVATDKGPQPVRSATFEIGDATVGQANLSLDSIARARISAQPPAVWAGEVFPVTYSLDVARRYFYQLGGEPDWNPAPLSAEPWGKPELVEAVVNDDQRVSILYKTRAYAKTPGSLSINPVSQLVNLATGNSSFSIFSRPSLEQFAITAPASPLTVKPLPSPAPAGFSGAVGRFTLDSKVVPAVATVGEPITWTLTLDGTGNWPDIAGLPPRTVSKDFTPITPQAKRTNKNDALFDATFSEDIVLIPSKPGTYTLGPVVFSVFNPATGAYENLSTKPVTIKVAPAAAQPAAAPVVPSSASPADDTRPPVFESAAPPAAIGALPHDPLPPSGSSASPLSRPVLIGGLLSSALCPLSLWLFLAHRRARRTDPARARREARIRLSNTIRALASSGNMAQASNLLRSWQRDAAILWDLPEAVPTPASFPSAAAWSALWSDADRTLYGAAPLPTDWPARADAALAAKSVPAFNPIRLFLPRNLLPLVILLSSFAIGPSSFASEGGDAYSKADYSSAEKAWRAALGQDPADWAARHNLALSLIQQNRSGEAAGHALAAFVRQPQNDTVVRTLAYAVKAAGVPAPAVARGETLDARLAALASPARWQLALVASAWLAAIATALMIRAAYSRGSAHSSFLIRHSSFRRALAAVSLILALAATIALRAYGPLADARAVTVVAATTLRSIPTDLDTQKTTPLPAGVIASADKTFLGWTRLRFPDGQTGWTRTETIVPLWK